MFLGAQDATIPDRALRRGGGMQLRSDGPAPDFEAFVAEYGERAFQFAYRLCGNVEESKELVQEAFVRMFRHWDKFDPSRSMDAWYFRILRNVFLDSRRRYDRRHSISIDRPVPGAAEERGSYSEAIPDGAEAILETMARRENAAEVRTVLEGLTPEHRAALSMVDMEGMSYEEMGSALGVPIGTVRSRVARARAAFRRALVARMEENR
jgi:RNA polymerase sigma-70 factor (ECF subfamily)